MSSMLNELLFFFRPPLPVPLLRESSVQISQDTAAGQTARQREASKDGCKLKNGKPLHSLCFNAAGPGGRSRLPPNRRPFPESVLSVRRRGPELSDCVRGIPPTVSQPVSHSVSESLKQSRGEQTQEKNDWRKTVCASLQPTGDHRHGAALSIKSRIRHPEQQLRTPP